MRITILTWFHERTELREVPYFLIFINIISTIHKLIPVVLNSSIQ